MGVRKAIKRRTHKGRHRKSATSRGTAAQRRAWGG